MHFLRQIMGVKHFNECITTSLGSVINLCLMAARSFLCGVCMFFLCLHGFPPGVPHHQKNIYIRLILQSVPFTKGTG